MCEYNCETAGGEVPKDMLNPMAWEVNPELIDDKSMYLLRLMGIHLLELSEETKDKLIDVFKESLGIKDFIEYGELYVLEFATGDKYAVCRAVYHNDGESCKLAFMDVCTNGIISDPYIHYEKIKGRKS
jgi:hypothetical protein